MINWLKESLHLRRQEGGSAAAGCSRQNYMKKPLPMGDHKGFFVIITNYNQKLTFIYSEGKYYKYL